MRDLKVASGIVALLLLAGCGGGSSIPDDTEVTRAPDPIAGDQESAAEPDEVQTDPLPSAKKRPVNSDTQTSAEIVDPPSGKFTAKDVSRALAGKTFSYNSGGKTGTVSYFSDGTFTYNEAGKGEGTGVWQASDGKLCEAFDPSSFLPKGTRSECTGFSSNGAAYSAGKKRLTPV